MATENVTWTVLPKAINIASGKTSLTVSLLRESTPHWGGQARLVSDVRRLAGEVRPSEDAWTIRTNERTPLTFRLANGEELRKGRWTAVFRRDTPVVAPTVFRRSHTAALRVFDVRTMHRAMRLEVGRVVAGISAVPAPLDTSAFDTFYSPSKTTGKPQCADPKPPRLSRFREHGLASPIAHAGRSAS